LLLKDFPAQPLAGQAAHEQRHVARHLGVVEIGGHFVGDFGHARPRDLLAEVSPDLVDDVFANFVGHGALRGRVNHRALSHD
jgi:hypothetical protein